MFPWLTNKQKGKNIIDLMFSHKKEGQQCVIKIIGFDPKNMKNYSLYKRKVIDETSFMYVPGFKIYS